jgi:hypothetical protein
VKGDALPDSRALFGLFHYGMNNSNELLATDRKMQTSFVLLYRVSIPFSHRSLSSFMFPVIGTPLRAFHTFKKLNEPIQSKNHGFL